MIASLFFKVNSQYDLILNRTLETITKLTRNGSEKQKKFSYDTNNLNQYLDRSIYVDIEGLKLEFTVSKDSLPPLEVGTLDFGTRVVNYPGIAYSNRVNFPFVPEETEFILTGEGSPTVQTSNGSRSTIGTVRYGTNIQAETPESGQTRIIEFTINGQIGTFTIIRE